MKKLLRIGLASAVAVSSLSAVSAPLTPEEALRRVDKPGVRSASPTLVHTVATPGKEAAVYVFNNPGGGFMVVSADDSAYALLGYSETGRFDTGNLPPQMAGWLEGYAAQIDAARAMEGSRQTTAAAVVPPAASALEGLPAIQPLLTTKWNQDAPYNLMCPEVMIGNNRFMNCYTGCVATSMAQVMNYFEYPETGYGSIQYNPPTIDQPLSMNFDEKNFDWANMRDVYDPGRYSTQEADAVAYLMKACGYSVEMQYSTSDSGAMSVRIVNALINNFKYDSGIRYLSRLVYSDGEWARTIYDNLANIGPVIYDGTAPFVGGHSFVCDGYDGKGYFHFNWGWGGLSDGYFTLEALNPTAIGIGGFAGGFNVDQNVVAGIRKPDGENHKVQLTVLQYGSVVGSIENGNSIHFGADGKVTDMFNYSADDLRLKVGAIFENVAADMVPLYSEGTIGGKQTFSIKSYERFSYTTYEYPLVPIPEGLPDGAYRVYLATMQEGFEGAEWIPIEVRYGEKNYVMLTAENGTYTIENVEPAVIKVENAWFDSDIIYGTTSLFHITISNSGDEDITRPYYPVFSLNDDILLVGDTRMLTIPAHETLTTEWETGLTRLVYNFYIDRAYTMLLWVADGDSGVVLDSFGFVKVKPAPTDVGFRLNILEFEGDGVTKANLTVDGKQVSGFIVPEINGLTLRINAVPSAYFDGELFVTASGAGSSELSTGVTEVYRKEYEIYKDVTLNTRIKVSYPEAEEGMVYSFKLYSFVNGKQTLLGEVFVALDGEGGVDGIAGDSAEATYYSLTGVRVTNPKSGDIVIKVVPGQKPVKYMIP